VSDRLVGELLEQWRADPGATYRSWFLWNERLKNFRSIRRGIGQVVAEIEAGTFGVAYRGSSLETVVHSIAEQRQIFKGADHAFLWKPKLRIPDIYENPANQKAFGRLLDTCSCCDTEAEIIEAIHSIDRLRIKGLGPAVANLLYFLHPTHVPPFNTAIVKGYNELTGSKVKLGSWEHFLAMRAGIVALNGQWRSLLSNDLGAVGALLFDIGNGRYPAPPLEQGRESEWLTRLQHARDEATKLAKAAAAESEADRSHTEIQTWLRDLGLALGFSVWVAANDRSRSFRGEPLARGCLEELPEALRTAKGIDSIRLIDVLWLDNASGSVSAAFEVEHSTSIYSGIVRMLDLAFSAGPMAGSSALFLVAPDARESEVRSQLTRPAFTRVADLNVRYLPYGELSKHRDAIARFGSGLKGIEAIARRL
jgi:type II restriction enzyme